MPMRRWIVAFAVLLSTSAFAVPFWGAKESLPVGTSPSAIKPGQFVWAADETPRGPICVVVSLTEQRAYVYRNGVLIGVSSVSTGKPGHRTPTGVFTILQKDKEHHSSIYDDAAMPHGSTPKWVAIGVPGHENENRVPLDPAAVPRVSVPAQFRREVHPLLVPGTTMVVTDGAILPETSGAKVDVMNADPPASAS